MALHAAPSVLGSTSRTSASWRSVRSLRTLGITSVLLGSVLLSSGCGASKLVIPDPNIPHQVAAETCVEVWARLPSGEMTKTKVRLLEGWWVASPQVVEAK